MLLLYFQKSGESFFSPVFLLIIFVMAAVNVYDESDCWNEQLENQDRMTETTSSEDELLSSTTVEG